MVTRAAEANVRETLDACATFAEYDARAVAIVSPFYYKMSPGAVYTFFGEVEINSPIDVTLYNIPMFASPIDIATIQRLAKFHRIIGCDEETNASSGVVPEFMRKLYYLTCAGQLEDAKKLQFSVLEFFNTLLDSTDFPEGFFRAVELRGFNVGNSRQPLSETQ